MEPFFADLGDGLELNLSTITALRWRRNPDDTLSGCEVGLVGGGLLALTAKQAVALDWALACYRATEPEEEAEEADPVAILGARAAVVQ